jgi:predicted nucleic acid-binding Zn ribbon protein
VDGAGAPITDGGEAAAWDGGDAPDVDGGGAPVTDGGEAALWGGGDAPDVDGGSASVTDGGSAPPAAQRSADLARSALDAARTAARRNMDPSRRRVAGRRRAGGARGGGYSGSGPDARDPQRIGALVRRLLADRGWEATAASAAVLSNWQTLVGDEIAAHCHPVSLRDGVLTLAAESTAWATQLRLLAPRMLARIRAELGPDVVSRVRVHGPTAPNWTTGPRRVAGRGPRDTYG